MPQILLNFYEFTKKRGLKKDFLKKYYSALRRNSNKLRLRTAADGEQIVRFELISTIIRVI